MPTSAADSTSDSPSQPARPRRRWYQFTLRTAGVWMALLCLLLGSFAWWRDRAERQRKVVEELRALGAHVEYRYFSLTERQAVDNPVSPSDEFFLCSWLRRFFGDDFVYDVGEVNLAYSDNFVPIPPKSTRSALRLLQKCPHIKKLVIDGNAVRGIDLEQLPFLKSLEFLSLGTRSNAPRGLLTNDDMAVLEQATRLQWLDLESHPIGDAGIQRLRNCQRLQVLMLRGTTVTDVSLDHLQGHPDLKSVFVGGTRVTPAGVKRFQARHPNCEVSNSPL